MFGVALTIVLVAGGELATSAMMILTQGALRGAIGWGRAGLTLLACMAGNLVGALLFAFLVHVSGVLAPGTPGGTVLAGMVEHKADETSVQLLVRGILCNLLVCLAVWCAARLRSEGARIVVVFGCVMVFITSGFEHVVANMTTFSLGLLRRPARRDRRRDGPEHRPRRRSATSSAAASSSAPRTRTGAGRGRPSSSPATSDSGALHGDREPLAIR